MFFSEALLLRSVCVCVCLLDVVVRWHRTMAAKQENGRRRADLRDHPRGAREGSLLKELYGRDNPGLNQNRQIISLCQSGIVRSFSVRGRLVTEEEELFT